MIVVWQDAGASGGSDIYAQHVLACGSADPAWPANGLAVTTAAGEQILPIVTTDGAGGAFVAWSEGGFPFPTNSDIAAQHVLSGGTIAPGWPANGIPVCSAAGQQIIAKLAPDGNGGAFITWDDRRDGNALRHVFVHHLLGGGLDPAWTTDGNRICPTTTSQTFPEICSDGSGGAIVSWSENRFLGTARDIYAQRVTAAGGILWAANGVPVCQAPGLQIYLGGGGTVIFIGGLTEAQGSAIVPDGAGGCFMVWSDGRTFVTNDDVYAQHLTSSGAVAAGWPVNGTALCTDPAGQIFPTIIADGAGGAIATWEDSRAGVFAQHVSSAGVADGPANGLLLSNIGTLSLVTGVTDGSGGAILGFSDTRNGDYDLFAQHVTTSGGFAVDPAWPVNGAAISTAVNDQGNSGSGWVVSDAAGGALFSWEDLRDQSTQGIDVYAQRVLASGTLPSFSVTGHVRANCPAPGTGLAGITVDAFAVGSGDLVATVATASDGSYSIPNLCWGGSYTITVVPPLGYAPVEQDLPADGCSGATDFNLDCLDANGTPRSMGYWKHQVGVATGGNGNAQVSASQLCEYLDLIAAHFNTNLINQVIVYQPPASGDCDDKLEVAKTLLDLQGSASMLARARQQLMSLLLNVAANDISQTQIISVDGATVSQAITYADNLIDSPTGDYERAKTICDRINNGQLVPAGMIPLGTQNIAYAARRSTAFRVTPNPSGGPLRFHFTLPKAESVELSLLDIAGRLVATVAEGPMSAGPHTVTWDGSRLGGRRVAEGLYFARLTTRDEGSEVVRVLRVIK